MEKSQFLLRRLQFLARFISLLLLASPVFGQSSSQQPTAANTVGVPALVKFSGIVKGSTGVVGVTFALYKDQDGGAPLWQETQSVQIDSTGHYAVQLGSTLSSGIPKDIFVSGEARWLGVQPEGQSEQARVLLLSVPYALKAADAETVGGFPPSAFVLAVPANSSTASATSQTSTSAPTSATPTQAPTATANFVPIFLDGGGTLGNSAAF